MFLRHTTRTRILLSVALLIACTADARPLWEQDAFKLYDRAIQLMESSAVSVPSLSAASAPITAAARQSLATMREDREHLGHTYALIKQIRAYLTLTDVMAKPAPLPDEAAKQFAELRSTADRIESNFRELLDRRERNYRDWDRDTLARYAEANAKLAPPQPDKPRIVFLGDSITDMWRLNEYFPGRDVVNRGISGQIAIQLLGRMKADVIDLKPAAVVIHVGTNDIGRGIPLAVIENNIASITDLAVQHHITPIIASVLPVSDYHAEKYYWLQLTRRRPPESIRALNVWLQKFCRDRNYAYVDYYGAVADSAGFFKTDASDDGLHPNATGYRLMAPLALNAIDQALAAKTPKGRRRR